MASHSNESGIEKHNPPTHMGGTPIQHVISLTPQQYESMYLTPKDAAPGTAVTSTFANPVGMSV